MLPLITFKLFKKKNKNKNNKKKKPFPLSLVVKLWYHPVSGSPRGLYFFSPQKIAVTDLLLSMIGFLHGSVDKESTCNAGDTQEMRI